MFLGRHFRSNIACENGLTYKIYKFGISAELATTLVAVKNRFIFSISSHLLVSKCDAEKFQKNVKINKIRMACRPLQTVEGVKISRKIFYFFWSLNVGTYTDVFRCHGIACSNFQDNFARQFITFEDGTLKN